MSDVDRISIIEKLKKIAALAERGVGGERVNAKVQLEKLMRKYGITGDDLQGAPVVKLRVFAYKTKAEKKLLFQCIFRGVNHPGLKYRQLGRGVVAIELDFFQFLEVDALYNYFKGILKKELDLYVAAFIQKHQLFSFSDDEDFDRPSRPSKEDVAKLYNMVMGMKDSNYVSPRRSLEGS